MILIIASIIVFCIAGIFNSEMDTIRFKSDKAWSQSDFWLRKTASKEYPYIRRTLLSFSLDGWHFCKSVMVFFFSCSLTTAFNLSGLFTWYYDIIFIIGLYTLFGIFFELFYEN